ELVEQIPAAAPDQRRDMADTVIAELMRHAIAEEMFVYPAMREHLPDGMRRCSTTSRSTSSSRRR
ncbi:MAG TPA: hypothetical protein VI357_18205, partial [Mycobacteriales bacterium]